MSMEILQHAVVTLVALAASAVLVRRVFGFIKPRAGRTNCAGCPSAPGTRGATIQPRSDAALQHPAILIRSSAHGRRQSARTRRPADSLEQPGPS